MKRLISSIALLGAAMAVFWNRPTHRWYQIDSKGKVDGLRIVFLSDLHNSVYGKEQSKLIEMIHHAAPDVILFGGDIADERSTADGTVTLMEGIQGLCPMYYIPGNHEYWMKNTDEIFDMFRDYGVTVLLNDTVQIETDKGKLSMLGLKDPDSEMRHSYRKTMRRWLKESYKSEEMTNYRVLLSHRPDFIKSYLDYDFDLILSGHAHGGQVRIPGILNGLYAPNQGFFPKYAGGRYEFDETTFIVSRGLSYKKILPRVMNPPEMVVIDLNK